MTILSAMTNCIQGGLCSRVSLCIHCILEGKAWFYHPWLLKYPLKGAPTISAKCTFQGLFWQVICFCQNLKETIYVPDKNDVFDDGAVIIIQTVTPWDIQRVLSKCLNYRLSRRTRGYIWNKKHVTNGQILSTWEVSLWLCMLSSSILFPEIPYNAVYKRRARWHNPQKVPVQITRRISHYFKYYFTL